MAAMPTLSVRARGIIPCNIRQDRSQRRKKRFNHCRQEVHKLNLGERLGEKQDKGDIPLILHPPSFDDAESVGIQDQERIMIVAANTRGQPGILWVGSRYFHGIDLLGYPHRPEFRSHARADLSAQSSAVMTGAISRMRIWPPCRKHGNRPNREADATGW